MGFAISLILTCSDVPVSCEHIDCYFCTTRGLVLYAYQTLSRADLIRLHAFLLQYSYSDANTHSVVSSVRLVLYPKTYQRTILVVTKYCTKLREKLDETWWQNVSRNCTVFTECHEGLCVHQEFNQQGKSSSLHVFYKKHQKVSFISYLPVTFHKAGKSACPLVIYIWKPLF